MTNHAYRDTSVHWARGQTPIIQAVESVVAELRKPSKSTRDKKEIAQVTTSASNKLTTEALISDLPDEGKAGGPADAARRYVLTRLSSVES